LLIMKINFQSSLRQKIILGYFAIAILILGGTAFTFAKLTLIEEKIFLGERISELFDTTLEIRRFERNYFLHRQAPDYQENIRYVNKMQTLLVKNKSDFVVLQASQRIGTLHNELEKYSKLMEDYVRASNENLSRARRLEPRIRSAGKEIVDIAEDMAATERRLVQSSLDSFKRTLILSLAIVAGLIIAIGQALLRSVVLPLKKMENSVDAVSRGELNKLSIPSLDREIVSIINTFNHMLSELELRQKHLLRSEKLASLGTMLSGVAHELNNPLSNISSSCQILLEEIEDADTDAKRELLKQIDEQTERAKTIVRSLLNFARDKAFSKEPAPFRELVYQTVRFIKGEIPAQATVAIDIPDDIVIPADRQRLQQAILNLVKNAVESAGEKGKVSISARKYMPAEVPENNPDLFPGCHVKTNAVDITVKDNGHGIPSEILPRIFDPFFTTKDVGKGMGLGLFIVHEIIEEHDGCISVNSAPDQGTSFNIRLPLQDT